MCPLATPTWTNRDTGFESGWKKKKREKKKKKKKELLFFDEYKKIYIYILAPIENSG